MLPSDMISTLQDYGYDDLDDTTALQLLNDGKDEVATTEPWPELQKTVDFASDANSNTMVAQPPDIAAITDLIDLTNRNKLQPIERPDFMSRYYDRLDEVGTPCLYFVYAGLLNIWPAPPAPIMLRMDYLMRPPDITTDAATEPLWLPRAHHRLIVLHALANASIRESDFDIAASFQAEYDRRLARARQDLWMKQYDRPKMVEDVYQNDWLY